MNSTPHNREAALELLKEYTQSESLLKHAYAVEAAMLWYADHFNIPEPERSNWGITGLLHDFDYEKFPTAERPDGHPFKGCSILAQKGWSQDIQNAILGHATYSGVSRDTLMAKTLFAVDELSGLITAATLVRPDKSLSSLQVSSVKKKFKDKAFAKGCNRDDIILGSQELQIELDQHIANTIEGLKTISEELGLA